MPLVLGFFEAFVLKSKACFIPIPYLDFVALFIGEQEQCAASQEEVGVTFDNRSKTIDRLSKVDTLTIQINLWSAKQAFHDSAPMNSAR